MKKTILTLAAVLMCAVSVNAQGHFRTFVDIYAGSGPSESGVIYTAEDNEIKDLWPALTVGMNVTGGYQIFPMLFAGVGFGAYTILSDWQESWYSSDGYYHEDGFHGLMCPVYADVRWTLPLNTRHVTPFADLKIGYQMALNYNREYIGGSYKTHDEVGFNYKGGLYFVPSVGIRFGQPCGFNLGFAYNTSLKAETFRVNELDPSQTKHPLTKKTFGVFMITLGADF